MLRKKSGRNVISMVIRIITIVEKNAKVNFHRFCHSFFLLNRRYRLYRGVMYGSFSSAYLECVIRSFIVCTRCTRKLMQYDQHNADSSEYMWVSRTGMRLSIDGSWRTTNQIGCVFFSCTVNINWWSMDVHSVPISLSYLRSFNLFDSSHWN